MRYLTPLRYPGGKAKLSGLIGQLMEDNYLMDGHYVEPYAGGAGVALSMVTQRYASTVHINDIDRSVYCFWKSVLEHTDQFIDLIAHIPLELAEWRKQKDRYENPQKCSTLELGFATFYLNRTNRSGIIKKGSIIGGLDQKGKWKIDARFNRSELISRVQRVASYSSQINIYNEDAVKFLLRVSKKLPRKAFIYADPPYYEKGNRLYQNFYRHEDHSLVANTLSKIRQPWIVSYDDVPQIRAMYSSFSQYSYVLAYSAAQYQSGAEVLIVSPQLTVGHSNAN